MPDLSLSRLNDGRSLLKIALELALIAIGVFLGLAGQDWRERSGHHQLAMDSLRRFRAEFQSNRSEVLRVHERHIKEAEGMRAFLNDNGPALLAHMADPLKPIPGPVPDNVIDSAGFDYSAWDVALATQSLAYIEPELVAMISRTYKVQQMIDGDHRAIQQVSYSFHNYVQWFQGVTTYFGDTVLHETLLLKRYDEVVPLLDKAIGD